MKPIESIIILLLYIAVIFAFTLSLTDEAGKTYTDREISPGLEYQVDGRDYKIPDVEISGKPPKILKEEHLLNLRRLITKVLEFSKGENIQIWASGGTLLGFVRHKTVMPWDDDADFHTLLENKKYFFSQKFKYDLEKYNLESLKMIGTHEGYTFYKGGIRLRIKGTKFPVCDIFFVERKNGRVRKIENWKKDVFEYNEKENWNESDIFPISYQHLDGWDVPMPNKPEKVVSQQYSEKALTSIKGTDPLLSHSMPYDVLENFIWV